MDNEYIIKEKDEEELLRVLSHYCTQLYGKNNTVNYRFKNKGKSIYEIVFYYLDESNNLEIELDLRKMLILYAKELGYDLYDYRVTYNFNNISIPYLEGIVLYLKELEKKKVKSL